MDPNNNQNQNDRPADEPIKGPVYQPQEAPEQSYQPEPQPSPPTVSPEQQTYQQPPQPVNQAPSQAYPPQQGYAPVEHPGRTLSIIGLVFAFVGLAPIGLVLSIVGLVQSKKSGNADILATLGLIFNILAIVVVGGIIALLTYVAYSNVQTGALDTKRSSDATSIVDAADYFATTSDTGRYPQITKDGYLADMATVADTIQLDASVTDKISASHPSSSNKEILYLSYCGGEDAATATGFEVEYWSEQYRAAEYKSVGTGCESSSLQDGSDSPATTELFN